MPERPSKEQLLTEMDLRRVDIQRLHARVTGHAEARAYLHAARLNLEGAERQLQMESGHLPPAIQAIVNAGLAAVMIDAVDADLKIVRATISEPHTVGTPQHA